MINSFDYFGRQEKPSITLCNPDHSQLYSLDVCYDTEVKLRWNAQSEFNFVFPQCTNEVDLEAYDYLVGKRVVLLGGIGYFIIADVAENLDGSVPVKSVSCLSIESELVYKKLTLFSGTYKFYDHANPTDPATLIGAIFSMIPNWTVGSVDVSLDTVYRTFNVSDTNIYQFLIDDVSTAYSCVFCFDYLNRSVSVIPASKTPNETDILFSFDNLIKNAEYNEISSEITTSMAIYGGNDLNIRSVNPLGGNKIYDFSFYKNSDWMSENLINSLTNWENKVNSYKTEYAELLADLAELQSELLVQQAKLAEYQSELASDQQVRAVRVQQGLDTAEIDSQIAQDQALIAAQNVAIAITNKEIASLTEDLSDINDALDFTNTDNFSAEEYLELQNFVFENSYKNDSITKTDSMTFAEEQAQAQQLYDAGVEVLAKAAIPRYSITLDSVNILALPEYSQFVEQLELGACITVDSGRGFIFEATLLEYTFSYDDPTQFEIVLSNRQRIDDSSFVLSDILGKSFQSSNAVTYQSSAWNDWAENKPVVLGNVIAPNGTMAYGIKAENVKGTINATGNLAIKNTNATSGSSDIYVDENGVVLRDPSIYMYGNLGIDADLPLAAGGQLSFRKGMLVSGAGIEPGSNIVTYEDITGQIVTSGSYFTTAHVYVANSLRVYLNGLMQWKDYSYTEGDDLTSLTLTESALEGDVLVVEYVST